MKILVTAFEPFGGNELNSSWEVATMLPDCIDTSKIVKHQLPVDYLRVGDAIRSAIELHSPDIVVSLGQSRKFAGLSIERVALNLMDSTKADNEGYIPVNEPIHTDGDIAYMTPFPVRVLAEACKRQGIAAQISNSAGTFVCNRLYYELLYMIAKEHLFLKALFVHLPYITEQDKSPSMDKELLVDGIVEILKGMIPWFAMVCQNSVDYCGPKQSMLQM